jgi:hypothetical protein
MGVIQDARTEKLEKHVVTCIAITKEVRAQAMASVSGEIQGISPQVFRQVFRQYFANEFQILWWRNWRNYLNPQDESDEESPAAPQKGSNGVGRPEGSIWKYVEKGEMNKNKRRSATCLYCNEHWEDGRLSAIKKHLMNTCSCIPSDVRQQVVAELAAHVPEPILPTAGRAEANQQRKRPAGPHQPLISGTFGRAFNKGENLTHNLELFRWLVTSGVAFNTLNNPFFLSWVKMISSNRASPAGKCGWNVYRCIFIYNGVLFFETFYYIYK